MSKLIEVNEGSFQAEVLTVPVPVMVMSRPEQSTTELGMTVLRVLTVHAPEPEPHTSVQVVSAWPV